MQQRVSRRRFLQGTVILGAAGALGGCGDGGDAGGTATESDTGAAAATGTTSAAADGDTLKIGLLIPLSGVFAALGEDLRSGFQLYLDQHGGLGGRPVELVVEDSEANPEVGLRKAQKLLREDRVALVSGIVSSAVALGVRDLFHESKVPLVISNAGANDITRGAASPYIFRTSFSNWQTTFSAGQYVYDEVTQDGVYLMAPDYAAGKEAMAGFREAYEGAGGTIIGESFPPFGTTQDYQPFLSEAQSANAKAVFAFFAGAEAVTFVQQYRDFGLADTIPLLGSGFLTDDGQLGAQGDAALGVRTSLHYAPLLENPTNKDFVQAYREAAGEPPTVYAVQSYDAAQLIDAALQETRGNASDPDALVEAMAAVGEIDSPRGTFSLDPATRNPVQTFYLREVQEVDGELANVVVTELGEFADPG